jgi:glucose/arabinose dehydrogenase
MDIEQFQRNRARFPADELEKHAGKYVAWSPEGTEIIVSADDPQQVGEALRASTFDPEECLITYVPHPDEVILGGGSAL